MLQSWGLFTDSRNVHFFYTGTNLLHHTTLQAWRCSSEQKTLGSLSSKAQSDGDGDTEGGRWPCLKSQDSGESRRGGSEVPVVLSYRAEATVAHIRPHSQHTQTHDSWTDRLQSGLPCEPLEKQTLNLCTKSLLIFSPTIALPHRMVDANNCLVCEPRQHAGPRRKLWACVIHAGSVT